MIKEEAIKLASARLKCMKCQTDKDNPCSHWSYDCSDCEFFGAGGNMEDQKEWLEMAIETLKQESCEDCVSREELKKWLDMNFSFGGALKKLELFDRLDKELPSVTPKLKWIPVSERLPEPHHVNKDFSRWVYVTVENKHSLLKAYVTEAYYCFSEEKWHTEEMEWGEEITAWQPLILPKPYEAESEEL